MLTLLAESDTYYHPDASPWRAMFALAVLSLYFLPWFIAARRNHPNRGPIVVVNVFLGWTLVGWVVALAWSLTAIPAKETKETP